MTAKRFTFKLLYGGTDFGFSVDPKFNHVSKDRDFWKEVIHKFYAKYSTISSWHEQLVRTTLSDGKLVMPTGRTYVFDRLDVARRLWFWRPKILNYPVQGTGADLVAIVRVALWKRLRKQGFPLDRILFISTVHDSIDLDINQKGLDNGLELCYNVCSLIKETTEDVPRNFERLFGVPFNLPVSAEISYGMNLGALELYKGH